MRLGDAWIAVAIGTLWGSPEAPRPVDGPALENPVRLEAWLSAMTTAQRRALGPTRVNTQAPLGERVVVVDVQGAWAKVVVPAQKSPWDARGYPGWIPTRQLRQIRPPTTQTIATVVAKRATLRKPTGVSVLEISYGTRLPVVGRSAGSIDVWVPDGRTLRLDTGDVVVHAPDIPALPKTAEAVIADARRYIGLPYLWDGTSSWGFDCSGITYLVFRTHGVLLPRDSFGQATTGMKVARTDLAPGDLVFLAKDGKVHHVGIYLGGDTILHAPRTGESVRVAPFEGQWVEEYAGARRMM